MESTIAHLYLLLSEKINALQLAGTNAFKFVGLDEGQLQDEEPRVDYPCALISLEGITFTSMGENGKIAQGPIAITIATTAISSVSGRTDSFWKEKGLAIFELEQLLKNQLDGWCPQPEGDTFSSLEYITATTDRSRLDCRIRALAFNIGIDDYTNLTPRSSHPVSPDITFV
jgi:hypothetical protein